MKQIGKEMIKKYEKDKSKKKDRKINIKGPFN